MFLNYLVLILNYPIFASPKLNHLESAHQQDPWVSLPNGLNGQGIVVGQKGCGWKPEASRLHDSKNLEFDDFMARDMGSIRMPYGKKVAG